LVVGLGVIVASWAVVGFRGIGEYPDLVHRLTDRMDERAYTVYAIAVDLGVPEGVAWAFWLSAAIAVLAACVVFARGGDERRAFVLALAASIAFSPIVWLHYFALLLVAIAVARPRLSAVWFLGLPLQLVVDTRLYNGSTFQTSAVLLLVVLTFVLLLVPPSWRPRQIRSYDPAPRTTTVISSSR
jgi:hypothetical protein